MKSTTLLLPLILFWSLPIFASDLTLSGEGVIQYRYPENFQESRRYIRKGVKTANGDCEFSTKMRLKVGEKIYTKEIAYNPNACESLIVEGLYTVEPQKKSENTKERTLESKNYAAAADSDWTVHAYLRTWYDDPIYLDVNSVTSEIWWDPTSGCASGNYFSSRPSYEWLALTGWNKLNGQDMPLASCSEVSLDTTASYPLRVKVT